MRRVHRVLITAALAAAGGLAPAPAHAQSARVPESQSVKVLRGSITGTVSDEKGSPLAGATVSAAGRTWATTVTDERGVFVITALPPGDYIVQAHLSGFTGSRRETVRVGEGGYQAPRLLLRRLDAAVATTGTTSPVYARPIMAAGFALPSATPGSEAERPSENSGDHSHSELAWRLRHLPRSILKDSSSIVTLVERDEVDSGSVFGRAVDSAASFAATLFADLPFSGEVNVLTTSAFAPGELFQNGFVPRGVAYLSIGAPTFAGSWALKAAMSEGELSSWVVAGEFHSTPTGRHQFDVGYAFSRQEYSGANPSALAGVKEGSRNVGEIFAYDRWALLPGLEIEYGGRYARHDYLQPRGLLSPLVGVSVSPIRNTWITATMAQRMIAPGAEEFLRSDAPGPWLPPERTFAPLGEPGEVGFSVERARSFDLTVEREFSGTYIVGVRRFFQTVDDQLVTLFGLEAPPGVQSVGHYYVASAGALDASGWGFRLRTPDDRRVRGSIDYSVIRTAWLSRGDIDGIGAVAPAAVRPERERIHDLTTSVETVFPETATRVLVLYKINSAYTRAGASLDQPGFGARFDVQVNQALPFGVGDTSWEVLVGVRNLFRDPHDRGSVYDELLVVRPPKRVVGGFLVRF